MNILRVYLAGPDVFLFNAVSVAKEKQKLCEYYGFKGVSPVDNEIDVSMLSKREAAIRISLANEETIRSCQLTIANLTPFRSPSADVGTAYELGFARALGLPVFGYTNASGTLLDRTREQLGNDVRARSDGRVEDSFHLAIEDFDFVDNLMLESAVLGSGSEIVVHPTPVEDRFTDLKGFEKCLQLAAFRLGVRKHSSLR